MRGVMCVMPALALLAGCAGSPSVPSQASAIVRRNEAAVARRGAGYFTLYKFDSYAAGIFPAANLVVVNQVLYGLTTAGSSSGNEGVAFRLGTGGSVRAIYGLAKANGGPALGGLTTIANKLYGATTKNRYSFGSVFALTTGGSFSTVHAFNGSSDGASPLAPLTPVLGVLYGVTQRNGAPCLYGTAFSLTLAGQEHVLHRFCGGKDGATPNGGLVELKGSLWGTTEFGGTDNAGTVFATDPSGHYRQVYSFKGSSDGAYPAGGLIAVNGNLIGTTEFGGTTNNACPNGCGTVFEITPTGQKETIYSFSGWPSDGETPIGLLLYTNGLLYGTTQRGGAAGYGTLFSLSLAGSEELIHSFGESTDDGREPQGGLVRLGAAIYGTAPQGGGTECGNGCGTAFGLNI